MIYQEHFQVPGSFTSLAECVLTCAQECNACHCQAAGGGRSHGRSYSSCIACGSSHCREHSHPSHRFICTSGSAAPGYMSSAPVPLLCRLAPAPAAMQPLMALQQLVSLKFTTCEHGHADRLPSAAVAALSCLEVLDASDLPLLSPAGTLRRALRWNYHFSIYLLYVVWW